ncbi:MAG TPA: hypothetical protein PKI71_12050 [Candidatus Rifleibacterium sp.]|nr:hypothetical protein [Candidatus Rifleibacterium sp.]
MQVEGWIEQRRPEKLVEMLLRFLQAVGAAVLNQGDEVERVGQGAKARSFFARRFAYFSQGIAESRQCRFVPVKKKENQCLQTWRFW